MSDSNNDDKKKPNTYFAGDGQAYEADPDAKQTVNELFDKARENGAVDGASRQEGSQGSAFTGSGRRLGFTEGPSTAVQPLTKESHTVKIVFYENGFVVDDGELQAMNDAESKRFLDTLHRGLVPPELARAHPNADIDVSLVDRSGETYVKKFRAFEGSGKRLTANSGAESAPKPAGTHAAARIEHDPAEPSGKVMLQLLDNSRVEVHVNPARHTVQDLHRHAMAVSAPGSPPFDLVVREVPRPRPLTDFDATLSAVKAVNCLVLLRAQ